jgi:hypothetical protein
MPTPVFQQYASFLGMKYSHNKEEVNGKGVLNGASSSSFGREGSEQHHEEFLAGSPDFQ